MARSLYKYDLFGKNIVEKLKKKGCLSEHTFKGVSGNKNIKGFAIDLKKCSPSLWQIRKKQIIEFGLKKMNEEGVFVKEELPSDFIENEAKMLFVIIHNNNNISWDGLYKDNSFPIHIISEALPDELLMFKTSFGISLFKDEFYKNNKIQKLSDNDIKKFADEYAITVNVE